MAWTDKARAASAASRRAHKKAKVVNPVSAKGPLSARLKRQAKRATITVARKDRQAERVYTGGNAQRHIGRPRSGYNRMDPPGYVRSARERADAVRSIAKTTKRPAQMAERLQFGKETWGQPKASKAYSTYNADKRKLSKPVSGKRAGSAVTAMGDAANPIKTKIGYPKPDRKPKVAKAAKGYTISRGINAGKTASRIGKKYSRG